MKAIIVAGGKGTRLRPLTETIPKPMVKVGGIPILEHTIMLLKKHGVTDIILALCYLPESIIEYFGDGSRFGVSIIYTFENPMEPLGTAGAILPAKELITDSCIVTYADVLRDLDITAMIRAHTTSKSIATINTYRHTGGNYKSSLLFDEDYRLLAFTELEKATTLTDGEVWSNGSFYIIEPEIFTYIAKNKPTDFAHDIFPKLLLDSKKISVFPSEGYFLDIGTLETLANAEKYLHTKKQFGLS